MGSVAAGTECVNGAIRRAGTAGACSPNGKLFCKGEFAFYLCDFGLLVEMGPVAAGTRCVGGDIIAA
jgi:hypothetical protein